jgi:hypothetical protein
MTTLAYDAVTITFSDDILWTDEYAWMAVTQRREYTVAGAMLVDSAVKQAGRTITLEGDDMCGWVTRATLDQLAVAAAIPGQQFTLTLRGVAHTVVFDHSNQALEAEPVFDVSDPTSTDYYVVTLRFVKV